MIRIYAIFSILVIVFLSAFLQRDCSHFQVVQRYVRFKANTESAESASGPTNSISQIIIPNSPPPQTVAIENATAKIATPFGRQPHLSTRQSLELQDSPSEELFNQKIARGNELLCLMRASVKAADEMLRGLGIPSQSGFLTKEQLINNGWTAEDYSHRINFGKNFLDLEVVLRTLGIPRTVSEWQSIWVGHSNEYEQNGEARSPTYAHYQTLFHTSDPNNICMVLEEMFSPKHRIRQLFDKRIPALHRFSDVTFIQYNLQVAGAESGEEPIPAPKYMIIPDVENDESETIMDEVARRWGGVGGYQEWPGLKVDAETEAGKALLATAHGAAVSWFLIQHKRQFGRKRVAEITLWKSVKDRSFEDRNLLFRIVDADV